MPTKLIMLAHGSSNASWSDAFFDMTKNVTVSSEDAALAFMELSEPSLHDECRAAAKQGYDHLKVLPLFLAKGRHLKKDVPAMISELIEELNVEIELLAPIGENQILRDAILGIVHDELK